MLDILKEIQEKLNNIELHLDKIKNTLNINNAEKNSWDTPTR